MSRVICGFAGHSKVYDSNLEEKIYEKCEELIIRYKINEFWVGHYGDFDLLAAKVVNRLKEHYPDIKLILVIPYLVKEIMDNKEEYYKKYDSILIAPIPESTPQKYRILKCNHFLVNNCSFLITYINYSFGGAWKTLSYAHKRNKSKIFNLGTIQGYK